MKALTIKQPWVHAMLREGKDIENRSWRRTFRGWIALHASAQPRRDAAFPRGHRIPDLHTLDYSTMNEATAPKLAGLNVVKKSLPPQGFSGNP